MFAVARSLGVLHVFFYSDLPWPSKQFLDGLNVQRLLCAQHAHVFSEIWYQPTPIPYQFAEFVWIPRQTYVVASLAQVSCSWWTSVITLQEICQFMSDRVHGQIFVTLMDLCLHHCCRDVLNWCHETLPNMLLAFVPKE